MDKNTDAWKLHYLYYMPIGGEDIKKYIGEKHVERRILRSASYSLCLQENKERKKMSFRTMEDEYVNERGWQGERWCREAQEITDLW